MAFMSISGIVMNFMNPPGIEMCNVPDGDAASTISPMEVAQEAVGKISASDLGRHFSI